MGKPKKEGLIKGTRMQEVKFPQHIYLLRRGGKMLLGQVAEKLGLRDCTSIGNYNEEVTGGYCSDMLSDVMAKAKKNNLWFTIHTHINIVAAALVVEVAGVVITGGREPEEKTLLKAREESVPIFQTDLSTFEIAGKFYKIFEGQQ